MNEPDPVAAWQLAHEIITRCRREALARHAHALLQQRAKASALRGLDNVGDNVGDNG